MDTWEQPLEARIAAAQARMLEEIRRHPTPSLGSQAAWVAWVA